MEEVMHAFWRFQEPDRTWIRQRLKELMSEDFWPDHQVRCECGNKISLHGAHADGWVDIEDLQLGTLETFATRPMILTGTCWRCFRAQRVKAMV